MSVESMVFAEPETARSTLRVSESELSRVVAELEKQSQNDPSAKLRRSERVSVPKGTTMTLDVIDRASDARRFVVHGRNVSDHGVGVLHGGFVHVGTRCVVAFTKPDAEAVQLEGVVKRCTYVTAGVHELGVMFDEAFPLREFLLNEDAPEPRGNTPTCFDASVLVVDDCPMARRMHRHMLARLGADVTACDNGRDALQRLLDRPYHLLLTDINMTPVDGFQLALAAKTSRPDLHVVAVTCDDRPETAQRLEHESFSGVVHKPLAIEQLTGVMRSLVPQREVMDSRALEDAIVSSLWHDLELRPLISAFVYDIPSTIAALESALGDAGYEPPELIAREIAVNAESHGYEPIRQTAARLGEMIRQEKGKDAVQNVVAQLKRQVARARLGLMR